ncbi:hypothetical protein BDN67DRAFT_1004716 [Paxillus ammoniavirescens]|nr:hypothetical protein BDN67DRAFT_1004716 [Paxillus ammoniavirescens]
MSEIVKNLSVTLQNQVGVTCRSDTLLTHGAGPPAKGHNAWTGKYIHYPSPIKCSPHSSTLHCTLAQQCEEEEKFTTVSEASCTLRARFVTLPELKEDFEKAEVERREKEKAEAEKQAKRKADGEVRVAQIERDIRDKVFDAPLSSFRRKDGYITLAGALSISQDGTVEELKTRIKNYIADPTHAADIAQNPRFSGLFLGVGKSRTKNPAAPDRPGRPDHTHHVDFGIPQ